MPNIIIDVWTRLHKKSMDDVDRDVQANFKKMAQKAANNFANELESQNPRIRRAAAKMLDANSAMATAQREAAKAARVHGDELSRLNQIQKSISDSQRAAAANAKTLGQLERGIGDARKDLTRATREISKQEEILALARRVHVKHARELRDAEIAVQEARLNGQKTNALAKDALELRKRDVAETQALRNATLDLAKARENERQAAGASSLLQKELNELRSKGVENTKEMEKASRDLAAAQAAVAKAEEAVATQAERVNRVRRDRNLASRALDDARNAESGRGRGRGRPGGAGHSGFGGGQGGNALGGIFTSIPFVPGGKAGAVIGSGLVATLGSVADAAVTASQSLWLLPAAAAAGGAAFVTLKMGLSGFDKALKDMGDPKKFAKDLAGLAPNAQQAALEIQKLVSGMDGLKMITQNALFKGVAGQLASLGQTFMPEIKKLTTGVAGAFNEMFQVFAGQLKEPGTSAAIGDLINNIVQAFHNLAPAMAPIVDAFSKIAKVGSDFLPGMATGFANLATKFANFIDNAQRSGQLHDWIQKGIDAAATLGRVIGELAHKIFDVFGNKNPDEFKSTLEGMVGAAIGVAQAIEGISQTVNNLVQDIEPVAQALGGWPNLIQDVIAIWAEWKIASTITQLMKMSEILGVTLPASAEAGAAGISSALASVAIPAWLATLMALWNMGGSAGPGPNIPGGSPMGPGSKQAQDLKLKTNAGQAYAKEHGGQMPPGYMDWLKGGKMPDGMDKYYVPPSNSPFFDSQGRPLGADGKPFGPGPANPTPYNPNMPKSQVPGFKPPGDEPWNDLPVPAVPEKGKKGKLPKVVSPLDPAFGAPPRPGETEGEYAAEGTLMQAKHRKADDEATLLELEKDNNATAEQIQAQKNKIIQDQREINKAEFELQNAQEAAYKKQFKGLKGLLDSMKDIGPQLDEDFGLSKGLAGLAKNLVEFVATLAAAPLLGKLEAVKAGDPFYQKGQFGALGMMAEHNHMQGRSGLLGIPFGQPGGLSLGGLGKAAEGYTALSGMGMGNGAVNSGLTAALQRAGIDPRMYPMLQGFAKAEGNNAFGAPTLGFRDDQAGATLDEHAQALAAQIQSRQSAVGPFPANGSPQDQAAWMASIVGQNGVGNQPSRQSYIDSIVRGFGGGVSSSGLGGGGGGGGLLSMLMGGGQGAGIMPAGMSSGMGGGISANPASMASMVPNAPNVEAGIRSMGGLPNGTLYPTSGAGAYQVPPWAQQLAAQFGLTASTYASGGSLHQMGYAFDFNGPQGNMDAFADYIQKNLASQTLQLIHADGNRRWGIASGRDVSGGGYYAGDYGGHFDHVHWATDVPPMMGGMPGPMDMGPSPSMPGVQAAGWHDGVGGGQGGGVSPSFPGPPPSPGPGGGAPGFPMPGGLGSAPGPGGGTPGFPMPGGGVDEGNPTPQGAPKGQGWQPAGGSGLGISGAPAAAITSAAGMFPGGGAAAQLAIQLANRSIQQLGNLTSIGVQGLQETFGMHDPDGGGNGLDDLQNNIFGRVLKGMAQMKPATGGTSAGKTQGNKDDKSKQGAQGQGQDQQGNPQFQGGLHVHGNFVQAPGQNPQTTVNDLSYMGALGASTPIMAG